MNEMKRGNDTMANEHGSLSINSQNIFPIIKKWMYSDHDIFYRELISNGCDAITKLKKLDLIGEYEADRKSTRLNSSHTLASRMPSSA